MRYCTNCGEDISRRGNRATKCEFCQRQDHLFKLDRYIIEKLGSQNLNKPRGKPKFCKPSLNKKILHAHNYAILPRDNTDTRQNII